MSDNMQLNQPDNNIENPEIFEVVSLKENTSASILRAFYADYWFFWEIAKIIKWEKTNPSNLIETLEETRSKFKELNLPEASNDEYFKKVA